MAVNVFKPPPPPPREALVAGGFVVVDSLFIVAAIVCGRSMFGPFFSYLLLYVPLVLHLSWRDRDSWLLYFNCLLMSCDS